MKYSVLDLSPIVEGSDAKNSFERSVSLAQACEGWGYTRFWMAEHHNLTGVASAATSVVLSHIGAKTKTIRIGAGGIMLPNHSPLVIAEQFGTLQSLYGDRIDLGLGRAPGTGRETLEALRRTPESSNHFDQDVVELLNYFHTPLGEASIQAVPGQGLKVPVWILGSSLYGAQLAAHLGLPYAFASHFAPGYLEKAAQLYRERFRPSPFLDKPHFMMAVNIFAAETSEEATLLRSSAEQMVLKLRFGTPGPLAPPVKNLRDQVDPMKMEMVDEFLRVSATGNRDEVESQLSSLIERYRPDEVMLNSNSFYQDQRLLSFEIGASIMKKYMI